MKKADGDVVSFETMRAMTSAALIDSMDKEEMHMRMKRARRLMEVIAAEVSVPQKKLGGMTKEEIVQIDRAYQELLSKGRAEDFEAKRNVFKPRTLLNLPGNTITWLPSDALGNTRAA